jgi:hypothetical protein
MTPHKHRTWGDGYRTAVQHQLDEPVLAAGLFRRSRGWGPLARRESSVPRTFVVAVTPTRLHAFAARARATEVEVGDEVAVWERGSVHVTSTGRRVTIAQPGGNGCVECRSGKDELSRSVVRYMEDPAVVVA